MIANYKRPRLEILQNLTIIPDRTTDRRVPLIIGQQFDLSRYGHEVVEGSLFKTAEQTLNYTLDDGNGGFTAIDDQKVDLGSVKLFAEELEASLAEFAAGNNGSGPATPKVSLYDSSQPSVLKMEGANFYENQSTPAALPDAFHGRGAQLGDRVYVDDGNHVFNRTVIGFKGKEVAASFGSNATKDNELPGASEYNPIDQSTTAVTTSEPAGYTVTVDASSFDALVKGPVIDGRYGDEFILTVATGGTPGTATFNVTSKTGLFSSSAPVGTTDTAGDFELNSDPSMAGVTVTIAGPSVTAGQVFKVRVYGEYSPLALSGGSPNVIVSGAYTGPKDTTYVIKVKTGVAGGTGSEFTGAVITVSDTNGVDVVEDTTIITDSEFDLGTYGLRLEFNNTSVPDQAGLKAGDIYYIHVKAESESTVEFDKIILSGPAVDTSLTSSTTTGLDVEFRLLFSGEIPASMASAGSAWTADADGIHVENGLHLEISERGSVYQWIPFVDEVGYLFPSFRAAVQPKLGEDVITVINPSSTPFGSNKDMDNPLAYGVGVALEGAFSSVSNKSVKALRVADDTLEAYEDALSKVLSSDNFYAVVPLSSRSDVHEAVAAHVNAASAPDKMNYREAFVGVDSPGEWVALSGEVATVSAIDGKNIRVNFTGDPFLNSLGLTDGDKIHIVAIDQYFEIDSVISDAELLLKTGPTTPISPATVLNIVKADTPKNTAEFLNNRAKSHGTRRVSQVWSDRATVLKDGVGFVQVPSMYLAAELAGLRCAVQPHQGLTNTELTSVTSAPNMHIVYTDEVLNSIAANGTMIVTQDVAGGPVFIRHQITTETDKGALFYEESVTSNVDDISFEIKDAFLDYIGKRNVNSRTVLSIRNRISNILDAKSRAPSGDIFGPQLIAWDSLDIRIDPQLADRIIVKVRLIVPLPLNNLTIELTIDQSVALAA